MRLPAWSWVVIGLLGSGWLASGCQGCGCGRTPEVAPPPAPEPPPPPPPAPEPEAAAAPADSSPFGSRLDGVPRDEPTPMAPGATLGLVQLPAVSAAELAADKRLNENPNLLPAQKKTLKALEKLVRTDPRFAPDRPMSGPPESPPDKPGMVSKPPPPPAP